MTGLEILGAAGSVLTIAEVSLRLFTAVSKFIKEARVAEDELRELMENVDHLRDTFANVQAMKEDRENCQLGQAEVKFWKSIAKSHKTCTNSLQTFEETLRDLVSGERPTGGWKQKASLRMKLNTSSSIIAKLEKNIHTHIQLVNINLTLIQVSIGTSPPAQLDTAINDSRSHIRTLRRDGQSYEVPSHMEPRDIDNDSAIDVECGINDLEESVRAARAFVLLPKLISAINNEDEDVIEVIEGLLEEGADVNFRDGDDWTPLHHAALGGNEDVIEILLEPQYKADIDATCPAGKTPLHYTTWQGWTAVAKTLLDHGAGVNIEDNAGRTCFYHAVERRKYDFVKMLLDKDVPFDMGNLPETSRDIKNLLEKYQRRNQQRNQQPTRVSPRSTASSGSSTRSLFGWRKR
ncbi:MAG: Ankyrin-2 [Geoglossum umbratile]|nr:MAG: Ankyrin-2 [Geoglossum umbratile]